MRCKFCNREIHGKEFLYPQGLTTISLCEDCYLFLQDANPSEITQVYWLYAFRKKGQYPKLASRSGKWLIFVSPKNVDEVWRKIKKAVEEGRLGNSAKVSTAKTNPLRSKRSKGHVICVYTYDWTDKKDVKRIREELRKLGITKKIPYKADEDTLAGRYHTTDHDRVSKYYE